jgi:hypothetical protein
MTTAPHDLAFAYVLVGLVAIGLPTVFFVIVFAPGLMRTTGEHIGQSESTMPDSRITNTPTNTRDGQKTISTQALTGSQFRPHRRRNFTNTP